MPRNRVFYADKKQTKIEEIKLVVSKQNSKIVTKD
jgi:hypothetical protein